MNVIVIVKTRWMEGCNGNMILLHHFYLVQINIRQDKVESAQTYWIEQQLALYWQSGICQILSLFSLLRFRHLIIILFQSHINEQCIKSKSFGTQKFMFSVTRTLQHLALLICGVQVSKAKGIQFCTSDAVFRKILIKTRHFQTHTKASINGRKNMWFSLSGEKLSRFSLSTQLQIQTQSFI